MTILLSQEMLKRDLQVKDRECLTATWVRRGKQHHKNTSVLLSWTLESKHELRETDSRGKKKCQNTTQVQFTELKWFLSFFFSFSRIVREHGHLYSHCVMEKRTLQHRWLHPSMADVCHCFLTFGWKDICSFASLWAHEFSCS